MSVDKPPVGLWLQAISACIFGVNGFGLLLARDPGRHCLRRHRLSSGPALVRHLAGLLAALALAMTPVVVATDRNNTIDSILILTLLLAAWAFISAAERRRLRYLLLGAVLVGVGFNIKMLAGLPAAAGVLRPLLVRLGRAPAPQDGQFAAGGVSCSSPSPSPGRSRWTSPRPASGPTWAAAATTPS